MIEVFIAYPDIIGVKKCGALATTRQKLPYEASTCKITQPKINGIT